MVSFVDKFGGESLPSDPTRTVTIAAGQSTLLEDIPIATGVFVSRRLYRRVAGSGQPFRLVAEIDRTTPDFVDASDVSTIPALVPPPGFPSAAGAEDHIQAQPDARLTVDPGITVKSDGVRIQTGLGGDLLAEGVPGTPVIFTSRFDDRYGGASGTFDSTNDGQTSGFAADWAGIYASPTSRLSLDHVIVAFAGGRSTINGTSAGLNALQIYQADARVTNSRFESNASGIAGADPNRSGLGPNSPAVIFVNGAQPILVNNEFLRTVGGNVAAISVNVNDLNERIVEDTGRQVGNIDLISSEGGNQGPLVRGNTIEAFGIAGMVVRGGLLSTGSVWDDTNIVHVVDGIITDSNRHTYGGLRLKSSIDESLVVKFLDSAGSLVATGKGLDIESRIGGTVQIIGQPDYPVVLTTIADDTVGAGVDPAGQPLTDTGSDGLSAPIPGSWTGIQLLPFANDRNVETITEREVVVGVGIDRNGTPTNAQDLGQIATREKASDENLASRFHRPRCNLGRG